jgi:hypothetical protein
LAQTVASVLGVSPGIEYSAEVVEAAPAAALLEAAVGADLLVLGSHGRGELAGLLLGSVTPGTWKRRMGCSPRTGSDHPAFNMPVRVRVTRTSLAGSDHQHPCSGFGCEFEADIPEIVTSVHVAGIGLG